MTDIQEETLNPTPEDAFSRADSAAQGREEPTSESETAAINPLQTWDAMVAEFGDPTAPSQFAPERAISTTTLKASSQ